MPLAFLTRGVDLPRAKEDSDAKVTETKPNTPWPNGGERKRKDAEELGKKNGTGNCSPAVLKLQHYSRLCLGECVDQGKCEWHWLSVCCALEGARYALIEDGRTSLLRIPSLSFHWVFFLCGAVTQSLLIDCQA
jgi:hypothetical protein